MGAKNWISERARFVPEDRREPVGEGIGPSFCHSRLERSDGSFGDGTLTKAGITLSEGAIFASGGMKGRAESFWEIEP